MVYRNRIEAAERLAEALAQWRGSRPLVVAIPRGAVPMGAVIAHRLDGDLDVVLVRKLHARWNPELAIGAVDERGWTWLAPHGERVGATPDYIEREKGDELAILRERRARYTPKRAPIDAKDRNVIVVDDGLATGATMIAALHAMRARAPRWLICAIPVAAPEALERVRPYADEVLCLETPEWFYAVGQAYHDFTQVSDDEVIAALGAAAAPGARSSPSARERERR
jgi:predicted phosphoribosyltransferase